MNIRGSFMVACLLTAAGAAQAGIFNTNGYAVQYRIFNGMPTSNLTANGVPLPGVDGMGDPLPFDNFPTNGLGTLAQPFGNMNIRDEYPFPTGNQGFANKTQAMLSADGGATALSLVNSESFDISYDVRLTSGQPLARKEGGFVFYNPRGSDGMGGPLFIDEGRLLVSSNSFNGGNHAPGETAIFGAAMPFTGGGAGGFPGGQTGFANDKVVNGQLHTMRFIYFAPGAIDARAAYEAFFDGQSSGVRFFNPAGEFDGVNGFADGTKIGLMAQFQYSPVAGDLADVDYTFRGLVPTPGAAGLLAAGGLVALRRRR